mmetsp:Transcript_26515/g.50902  ORF Transcript_26515/g.50902 Transcript_26515/m.50902 type:complete len:185 (+) Transcript_26515:32-586(+)
MEVLFIAPCQRSPLHAVSSPPNRRRLMKILMVTCVLIGLCSFFYVQHSALKLFVTPTHRTLCGAGRGTVGRDARNWALRAKGDLSAEETEKLLQLGYKATEISAMSVDLARAAINDGIERPWGDEPMPESMRKDFEFKFTLTNAQGVGLLILAIVGGYLISGLANTSQPPPQDTMIEYSLSSKR